MDGFIIFIIALLASSICGFICGYRGAAKRNPGTDGSDAGSDSHFERVAQERINAVSEGNAAAKKIQDIIHDIRGGSSRSSSDGSDSGQLPLGTEE